MSNQKHIQWIDQAKGIGILLVVLGHMNIPEKLSIFIFSFHMPLFFIISGMLFNESKYSQDFKRIAVAKGSTLLWPFLTFTVLAIGVNVLIGNTSDNSAMLYILESVKTSLSGMDSVDTPLWFLTALFSTEIIFSQILRFRNKKFLVLVVVALFVLGMLNSYYLHFRMIFNIHIAIVALLFFMIGWFYKKSPLLSVELNKNITFLIILVGLFITTFFALENIKIDIYDNNYGVWVYFLLTSIFGSFSLILLSTTISIKYISTVLLYLGKNSLIILAIHVLVAPIVASSIGHLPLRADRIISIVLIFLAIELINRFAPFMLKTKLTILQKDA